MAKRSRFRSPGSRMMTPSSSLVSPAVTLIDALSGVGGRSNYTKKRINVPFSLKINAVWSCVTLRSGLASRLPVKVYKVGRKTGLRGEYRDNRAFGLLNEKPNGRQTPSDFWREIVLSCDTYGQALIWKVRNPATNGLMGLQPLVSSWCRIEYDSEKLGKYVIVNRPKGEEVKIKQKDFIHIMAYPSVDSGITSLSPITQNKETIALQASLEEVAGRLFSKGMMLDGIFTHPKKYQKNETNARIRQGLSQIFSGSERSGQQLVLEGGMDYKPLSLSPLNAQLIETFELSLKNVASIWNVPAALVNGSVGGGGTLTYATQKGYIAMLLGRMDPLLRTIGETLEADVDIQALSKFKLGIDFDRSILDNQDGTIRFSNYVRGCGLFITANEIRAREGLPSAGPIGDVLVPRNAKPLASAAGGEDLGKNQDAKLDAGNTTDSPNDTGEQGTEKGEVGEGT